MFGTLICLYIHMFAHIYIYMSYTKMYIGLLDLSDSVYHHVYGPSTTGVPSVPDLFSR